MAIEAPYSKYSKNSFKIGIVLFVAMAIIFAYDGYLSKYEWSLRRSFYEKHFKKLFSLELGVQGDLDNGIVSEGLRQEFEKNKTPLLQDVTVSVEQAGSKWLIIDKLKKYSMRKEEGKLNIYEYGKPDFDMVFNQKSPFVFVGLAAVTTAWFWACKNKKVLADENELIISDKERISYDSIQQIDKTYYEKKGFFVITYKDKGGKEVRRKLNDRTYDNLAAILEHLVAKIS